MNWQDKLDDRTKLALTRLSEYAPEYGRLCGLAEGTKENMKAILGVQSIQAEGSSQAEREARARDTEAYKKATETYVNAVGDKETMRLKIELEKRVLDVWQTTSANSRAGIV